MTAFRKGAWCLGNVGMIHAAPRRRTRGIVEDASGGIENAQPPTPAMTLTIKKKYMHQIFERRKTVEGRINVAGVSKLNVGQCVALRPGQFAPERCYARVTRMRPFDSFREMLLSCGFQACIPDARDIDEALAVYHSFTGFEEKAAESGVMALDVEPLVMKDKDGVLHDPVAPEVSPEVHVEPAVLVKECGRCGQWKEKTGCYITHSTRSESDVKAK